MSETLFKDDFINTRYNKYLSEETGGNQRKKNHFETKQAFRRGCSSYQTERKELSPPEGLPQWDQTNFGGPPIDYDANKKIVYVDRSDSHNLLIGATGSKKSRLVVMPMIRILAEARENIVICDPKGEIYDRTAGFLKERGYVVHAINLRNPGRSDGWNILEQPFQLYCQGKKDEACGLINDVAINLMPITGKDPYWDYSARDLFFGLTLLMFELRKKQNNRFSKIGRSRNCEPAASVCDVLKLRRELFCDVESSEIQRKELWKFAQKDPQIYARLIGIVVCPTGTMSCILSVFDQHMSCFSLQPQITAILSQTTFDLKNMEHGREAVFLILPDEKTTFHKIVSVFIKQIYEYLIGNAYDNMEQNRYAARINFVLDEFSSLPQIPDFPQMISASRSRNIRFTLILQSKNQLRQRYEAEADTIMSNCANWMFLATREIELLKELSLLSGTIAPSNEPLMTISHLQHMNKEEGECLVFNNRKYPYLAHLPDIDFYDEAMSALPMIEHKLQELNLPAGYTDPDYFESVAKKLN